MKLLKGLVYFENILHVFVCLFVCLLKMSYTDKINKTSTKLVHQMLTIQSCQNAVAPVCKESRDFKKQ